MNKVKNYNPSDYYTNKKKKSDKNDNFNNPTLNYTKKNPFKEKQSNLQSNQQIFHSIPIIAVDLSKTTERIFSDIENNYSYSNREEKEGILKIKNYTLKDFKNTNLNENQYIKNLYFYFSLYKHMNCRKKHKEEYNKIMGNLYLIPEDFRYDLQITNCDFFEHSHTQISKINNNINLNRDSHNNQKQNTNDNAKFDNLKNICHSFSQNKINNNINNNISNNNISNNNISFSKNINNNDPGRERQLDNEIISLESSNSEEKIQNNNDEMKTQNINKKDHQISQKNIYQKFGEENNINPNIINKIINNYNTYKYNIDDRNNFINRKRNNEIDSYKIIPNITTDRFNNDSKNQENNNNENDKYYENIYNDELNNNDDECFDKNDYNYEFQNDDECFDEKDYNYEFDENYKDKIICDEFDGNNNYINNENDDINDINDNFNNFNNFNNNAYFNEDIAENKGYKTYYIKTSKNQQIKCIKPKKLFKTVKFQSNINKNKSYYDEENIYPKNQFLINDESKKGKEIKNFQKNEKNNITGYISSNVNNYSNNFSCNENNSILNKKTKIIKRNHIPQYTEEIPSKKIIEKKTKDKDYKIFKDNLHDYFLHIITPEREKQFFKQILPESVKFIQNLNSSNNLKKADKKVIYRNNYLELTLCVSEFGRLSKKELYVKEIN